jgi:ATP/maltotriose-dependent transcriptional regulator MalT
MFNNPFSTTVHTSLPQAPSGSHHNFTDSQSPSTQTPPLALIFEQLAYGVLIVNIRGQILHANQSARAELAAQRWLALRSDHVHALRTEEKKALSNALITAQCGQRSVLQFGAGSDPLVVAVVPLMTTGATQCEQVALLFARPMVCDNLMLHHFGRSHKLTGMEECVLRLLCEGLDQNEMSQRLKVALSTVRSHMKSIAAKTGCHGMRALLAKLATLPPMLQPLQGDAFSAPLTH